MVTVYKNASDNYSSVTLLHVGHTYYFLSWHQASLLDVNHDVQNRPIIPGDIGLFI